MQWKSGWYHVAGWTTGLSRNTPSDYRSNLLNVEDSVEQSSRTRHVGNSPTLTSDLPKRSCPGYNLTRVNSRPGQVTPFPDEESSFRSDKSRLAPQVYEANLHLTKFPAIVTENFEPDWSILQSHKLPDGNPYSRRVGTCVEFLLPHPCMQGVGVA